MKRNPTRRRKNPHADEIGYVSSRKNHLSGGWCVLYDVAAQGLDPSEGRWSLACADHGSFITHHNKRDASALMTFPALWCDACAAIKRGAEQPVLRQPDEAIRQWALLAKGDAEKCIVFETLYGMKPDTFWD